ncbi:hypothetical protein A8926_3950 [Saccharopolyspora spinosa]|uniref:Uncharacterized protein n=1 Tax=Saccharopolyspora spinosa TaxID=60894 RepID=A0A2N3XZP7_SACSN|nr:hypothetical protein A8926_3950 [Saccharopolyspora spinosa]
MAAMLPVVDVSALAAAGISGAEGGAAMNTRHHDEERVDLDYEKFLGSQGK